MFLRESALLIVMELNCWIIIYRTYLFKILIHPSVSLDCLLFKITLLKNWFIVYSRQFYKFIFIFMPGYFLFQSHKSGMCLCIPLSYNRNIFCKQIPDSTLDNFNTFIFSQFVLLGFHYREEERRRNPYSYKTLSWKIILI